VQQQSEVGKAKDAQHETANAAIASVMHLLRAKGAEQMALVEEWQYGADDDGMTQSTILTMEGEERIRGGRSIHSAHHSAHHSSIHSVYKGGSSRKGYPVSPPRMTRAGGGTMSGMTEGMTHEAMGRSAAEVVRELRQYTWLEMCRAVSEEGLVEYVQQTAMEAYTVWLSSQTCTSEEVRRCNERLGMPPWLVREKQERGGKTDIEKYEFEPMSQTIRFDDMINSMENIASTHHWTLPYTLTLLATGGTLEGEARSTFLLARRSDELLKAKIDIPSGDVIQYLLLYLQVRFRVAMSVGQPTAGTVINAWLTMVLFEVDTAKGRFDAFTRIMELVGQKAEKSAQILREELQRQANKTAIGRVWWAKVSNKLDMSQGIRVSMGSTWVLTWDNLKAEVDRVYQEETIHDQTSTMPDQGGPVTRGRSTMVHALLVDDKVKEREAAKRSGDTVQSQDPRRGDRSRSPFGDRARSPYGDRPPRRDGGGWSSGSGHPTPFPTRQEGYGDRGDRGYDRPTYGDRRRQTQDRFSDRYGRQMNSCRQCGCSHLEDVDSRCPWRPVDERGKLRSTEFNGWDPVYWSGLPYQIRSIMTSRVKMLPPDHEAHITDEMGNQFIKRMEEQRNRRE
jgi:hypothetical protein